MTSDKLQYVLDTIANTSSAQICANALSSSGGGLYVNLMGIDMPRKDVENVFFLGYTVTGEAFEIEGERWDAVPEDYELAKKFYSLTEKLLEQGKLKTHVAEVRDGGLRGILQGMEDLKKGKVSGVKLVYRIGDSSSD